MRYIECTTDRRRNRYIESEKGQTRMHQARKVCDRTLPNHSGETDESLGVNLMQERGKVE